MVEQRTRRRTRRAIVVGAVAAVALAASLPGMGAPLVEASVAQAKDKDSKKKNKKDQRHEDDDRVAEGHVLAIDTSADPPELLVGTGDGEMVVKVLKTDEIALAGVGVGDYVRLEGEKSTSCCSRPSSWW